MCNEGTEIYRIAERIFPICRSLTGNGVRETLRVLSEYVPEMTVHEVPSGTRVFDWTIPKEWNIREAYIEDETGEKVIDFRDNNLHVMGYSIPVDEWMSWSELRGHIYTQPEQPEVIPYVTSYYKERWGFCMSQRQKDFLDGMNRKDGADFQKRENLTDSQERDDLMTAEDGGAGRRYHVRIDSELTDGSLTYGEIIIPGETADEILFSTYVCHPSMANNECSGPALAVGLARWLKGLKKRKYTYRFLFNPETIGSVTYLSRNLEHLKAHLKAGFVLSCVGDDRDFSIVHSRYGDTLADRVLKNVLSFRQEGFSEYSFLQRGSDERQYNAPGVDLPVVTYCRTKYGEYPEYHTSADDMDLVSPAGFQGSFDVLRDVAEALEHNEKYRVNVLCEPQLGKRGLYPTVSQKWSYGGVKTLTDFIAYADGRNDLIDISDRIGAPCRELIGVAEKLMSNGLISIDNDKTL